VSKDRAAPFSRKHRKYWITITGGMIFIGLLNVAIGMCTYTPPVTPTPIIPVLPGAAAPARAVPCPVEALVVARIGPGTITACVARGDDYDVTDIRYGNHVAQVAVTHGAVTQVDEQLLRPEIPATVMRAFAVAYPRTIPDGAVKRSRPDAPPIFIVAFPPGKDHAHAMLDAAGAILATD
jgi:hypothetical protein